MLKSALCILFQFIVLQIHAQNRLLVAKQNEGIDSVRYFYDKDNNLVSEINYIYNNGAFEPKTLNVYPLPEDTNFNLTITYSYNVKNASWQPIKKQLQHKQQNIYDTWRWDEIENSWKLHADCRIQEIYENKLLKYHEIKNRFYNSGQETAQIIRQTTYKYNTQDSLISRKTIQADVYKNTSKVHEYDSFTYEITDAKNYTKTHYLIESWQTSYDKIIYKFSGKKKEIYLIKEEKEYARYITEYDAAGFLISEENINYQPARIYSFLRIYKCLYVNDAAGRPINRLLYLFKKSDSSFQLFEKTDYNYSSTRKYLYSDVYIILPDDWCYEGTNYSKYDEYDSVIETGQFGFGGRLAIPECYSSKEKSIKDSSWQIRYYYKNSDTKYKHAGNPDFLIHPNPSNGMVNANIYSEEADELEFSLMDLQGKMIFTKNFPILPGPNNLQILSGNQLANAIYIFTAKSQTGKLYKRDKLLIIR